MINTIERALQDAASVATIAVAGYTIWQALTKDQDNNE